jgi:hypothetical protein
VKPEDRKRLKQHIEMVVEHKMPAEETVISEGSEPSKPDVSVTQDVSIDIKTPSSIENTNLDYYKSEPDFDKMPIEKINQYLREHGYDPEKVGLRGQILAEALTKNIIAREIIQRLLADPGGCGFCDFGVLRKPDNPLKGHDENCPYLAAHAYLDNETSTVVKRDLSDFEFNELGAQGSGQP